MAKHLTREQRARRYLQASQSAGYTGLPAEHREAYEAQMRSHERAYPGVREHALVGADQDFDKPLAAGEREHQRELREREGIQHSEVLRRRRELRASSSPRRPAARRRSSSPRSTGPRIARAAAGSAGGAIATTIGSGGNTLLYLIGVLLGLSLIYLLVAGKGVNAVTGVTNAVVGGVRAFIAPVDPIAAAEQALGAAPVSHPASPSAASAPGSQSSAPGTAKGAGGGFLAPGEKLAQYSRHDQGRDIRVAPGAPIVAPGAGRVLRVASDPAGFGPDYPIVHFTSGAYAGEDVYIGHTDAALRAGSSFRAGQILARTSRTGHNAPPGWAEIGFARGGSPGPFGQPAPF